MKQHISKKQWDELSKINKIEFVNAIDAQVPKGEELGVTWTFKRDFRPNIGQMIEFLDENNRGHEGANILPLVKSFDKDYVDVEPVDKSCDALWEATKEVLEK